MDKQNLRGKVLIPAGVRPWTHELRVADILALAGHTVEFLPTSTIKTADILLDGVEFEIKSPFTDKWDKIERNLKRATKQSCNIIFDSSRVRRLHDDTVLRFLTNKFRQQKQIKRLLFITKNEKIIDISTLI